MPVTEAVTLQPVEAYTPNPIAKYSREKKKKKAGFPSGSINC